jgi:nicotinate-nucleotide pyrophosphorylase (carboxylating)
MDLTGADLAFADLARAQLVNAGLTRVQLSGREPGVGDAAFVKDNHVAAAGGIGVEVRAVHAGAHPGLTVEVESDSVAEVREALNAGARFILLDNMPVPALRKAVAAARQYDGVQVEASGGLRLASAWEVALTGIDYLAVGALTHSSRALDLGLDYKGTS